MKFCGRCTNPLALICPKCRFENPPGFKFCGQCTAPLSASEIKAAPSIRIGEGAVDAEALEGERKTVTALFADIKGSTELERDLDPEEARAIVDPVLQLMMAAVHRYDGYVAQSTGDGIFAVFGAPSAHEDHPQRALHAALAMQEELHRYTERLRSEGKLAVEARVGVNTGEVVMRTIQTGGHTEYTPVGHVINLAARMQTVAPAGGVAISEQTRCLVEGYFELHALGPTAVKGIAEPVNVYEVTGVGPLHGHFELAARRGLTKFVGRERELGELRRALGLARGGHGQVVAVVAEAGTGKSRLMFEFKATLPAECKLLEAYSVSHGKASAWLPLLELLHTHFGITDIDDVPKRRGRMSSKLVTLDPALSDTLPYLFWLLGIQENPDPLAEMDAQVRKRRTLVALKRILLRESLEQPLVIIFEDLHWIDSETQALLDLLAESIAGARVLLLVNYRPEYRHEWSGRGHYVQLRLDPLGGENAAAMLTALLGEAAELEAPRRLIARRSGGNPFFIEEMVQSLFEQGILARNGTVKLVRPVSQAHLPFTVQGVLASRIDRLPTSEKELLQTLAVIGPEFPLALVKQTIRKDEAQLKRELVHLQLGELLHEQPSSGDVQYAFKHALTQEVAYHSILSERRKKVHEGVGSAIEALYQDKIEEHLAELAYHYRRSSDSEKAIVYLKRAADQATQRSSAPEAEAQYRDAISIIRKLPSRPDSHRLELGVQLGLSAVLIGKGWGASVREEPLVRAMELSDRVGDRGELLRLLFQTGQFYLQRLRWGEARQLSERALALAQSIGDRIQEAGAWHNLAEACFWSGDLIGAKARCEKALGLLADVPPDLLVPSFGHDLWMITSHIAGIVELILGRPDCLVEWEDRLIKRAGSATHVYSKALGMVAVSWITAIRRDLSKARDRARIGREICEEHGFAELLNLATGYEGYARFWQGEVEVGIAEQKRAIEQLEALGTRNRSSWRMAWLAEAQLQLGELGAAESSLERAFEIVKETGEGWAEPEVQRVTAEAILRKPGGEIMSAQRHFEEAVAIARKQSSKWWELRATVGLARLLAKQGRREEARPILADIYSWFTQGFDTVDLTDAKTLLDELNRADREKSGVTR
jgi:class 3 adenylate cyclase/tetratricopeptide (TPR) repeat protein